MMNGCLGRTEGLLRVLLLVSPLLTYGACQRPTQPEDRDAATVAVIEGAATATVWAPDKSYARGDLVSFEGVVYEARQAHRSAVGHEPSRAPALWMRPTPTEIVEWTVQTNYVVGSGVLHGGSLYECLQAHVSDSADWTPPRAGSLWRCASASCGGGACAELRDGSLCDAGNRCTAGDRCRSRRCVSGPARPMGSSCSDGNACNGLEICDGRSTCRAGRPVDVDDGQACTADICEPTTGTVTHAPDATRAGCNALHPRLECVAMDAAGALTAVFGYTSDLTANVNVPVGTKNKIAPFPDDRGQPTYFLPGERKNVFAVPLPGGSISWTLGVETATATDSSPRCTAVPCDASGGLVVGPGQCVPVRTGELPLPADSVVATGPPGSVTPGRVSGDLEVTGDGAFAYRVPLALPPGRMQMEPAISLAYNSRQGDGPLGVGWTLDGVSEITRCKKTFAQNGAPRAIQFDDTDAFCLDGNQLVPIEPDAQGRRRFRTEADTFALVTIVQTTLDGPLSFEVRTKDGRIHIYGPRANSILEALRNKPSAPSVDNDKFEARSNFNVGGARLSWAIEQTRDRLNNTINYVYDRFAGIGDNAHTVERTLARIEYTGHLDGRPQPAHVVAFNYERRPDARFSYVSGLRIGSSRRLSSVEVLTANGFGPSGERARAPVRTYRLKYANDKSVSRRSLLQSIAECDGQGVCKPPTTFTYTPGSDVFVGRPTDVTDLRTNYHIADLHAGDINGDGLDDILYRVPTSANPSIIDPNSARWFFRLNRGDATFGPAVATSFPAGHQLSVLAAAITGFDGRYDAGRLVDLNMDGKADFLAYDGETNTRPARWRYFMSNGNGFDDAPVEQTEIDTFPPKVPGFDVPIFVSDMNGDGYPEVQRPLWTLRHQQACSMDPTQVPGFDCFQALGVRINDRGKLGPWRVLVEEKFFPPNVIEVQEFPFQHNRHKAFWFTNDVDGDGTVDFLASETVGVPGNPFLQGKPLLRALHLDPNGAVKGAETTLRWRHSRARGGGEPERRPVHHYFVDVNGDGLLDDVMTPELVEGNPADPDVDPERTSRPFLALNTGNGYAEVNEALLEPSATPLQGLHRVWKILQDLRGGNVQVLDIDQDGRQDLLLLDDADGHRPQPVVYMAQGEARDLLAAHPVPPGQASVDPNAPFFTARPLAIPLSKKGVLRARFRSFDRASFRLARVGDFDGDGLEDIIQLEDDGALHVYTRNSGTAFGPRADLLREVRDGMGGTAAVVYRAITEPQSGYTRGLDCPHPQYCVNRGVVVVRELLLNLNRDGRRVFQYEYEDGRSDLHGRGWLGFAIKRATDFDTKVKVSETYDNVTRIGTAYPIAGLLTSQALEAEVGTAAAPVFRLDVRSTTYTHLTPAPGTFAVVPHVITETESEGGTEHRRLVTTADEYDSFGNAGHVTIETGRPGETGRDRFERRPTYRNDTALWLIGLLTNSVETSTGPNGETDTRTVRFDRHPRTGFVLVETTEPPELGQPARPEFRQTVLGRDGFGNVTSVTDFDSQGETRQLSIRYDALDQTLPIETRTKLGVNTRLAFLPAFGLLAAREDANGVVTRRQYDGFGRLRHEEQPTDADTDISYAQRLDGTGMEITATRGGGRETVVLTDHLGREVVRKERGFDGRFNVVLRDYEKVGRNIFRMTRPFKDGEALGAFQQLEMDNLGRVRFERFVDGTFREFQYQGPQTTTFDQKRNVNVRVEDAARRVLFSSEVDDTGRELLTGYTYGPFGVLRRIEDDDGNVTEIRYDRLGRRTALIDPDSGTTNYVFNGHGELVREADGNGAITDYRYDPDGRPRAIIDGDGVDTFDWDGAANGIGLLAGRTRVNKGISDGLVSTGYRYDSRSQIVGSDWQIKGEEYTVAFAYDAFGRRQDTTYPAVAGRSRVVVRNTYNQFTGDLQQVGPASDPAVFYWRTDARDAFERLTAETFGNGLTTTIAYDPVRDVLQRRIDTRTRTGGVVQAFAYDYDANGNLEARRDERARINETFQHDALNRLKRWTYGVEGRTDFAIRFEWDDIGNLTKRVVEKGAGVDNTFSYFDRGVNAGPHAVHASSLFGFYTYDKKGNQVSGPNRRVSYTAFNLPKVITTGEGRTEFAYDARHRRVWKGSQAGRETVYVDGLYERRRDGPMTTHVFHIEGAEGPVAQLVTEIAGGRTTDRTLYLHAEHLGSIEAITNSDGAVERRFKLDPWGRRIDPQNPNNDAPAVSSPVRKGFTGHEHDDEFLLINMGGRIYDPRTTRFLTPDPVISSPFQGSALNRYAYALNRPLLVTDPTGLQPMVFDLGERGIHIVEVPTIKASAKPTPSKPRQSTPTAKPTAQPRTVAPKGDDQQTASVKVAPAPHRPPPTTVEPPAASTARGITFFGTVNFLFPAHTQWASRPPPSSGNPYQDLVRRANQQAVVALGNATRETGVAGIQAAGLSLSAAQMTLELGAEMIAMQAAARLAQRAPDIVIHAADGAEAVINVVRGGAGPVRQGQAGVQKVIEAIEAAGGKIRGAEITIEAGGVRTRPDLFVELAGGKLIFVEVKTGATATWTTNQTIAFPIIWARGGIPRGAKALDAGLKVGKQMDPTPVWTVFLPWPL